MANDGVSEPTEIGSIEIKHSETMSSGKALVIARLFAAQWGAEYPFGFLINDVWYIFPNAHTVLTASTAEEADALNKPLLS